MKVNLLLANVYDLKDFDLFCCNKHELNVELAINLEDLINKLKEKKYNGLILGNKPLNSKYSAVQIINEVRKLNQYKNIPAIVLVNDPKETVYYNYSGDPLERVLILPFEEISDKITDVIHNHLLGLNS